MQSPKDPIHHYYSTYGIVPPWILFKSVYFSTMVNFIDQFKVPQQTALMRLLFNYEHMNMPESNARMLMMDLLFVCMEFRNNAAHGGRMYNFLPHNVIRASEILGSNYTDFNPQYTDLIDLLNTLRYKNPYNQLHQTLTNEINRHCKSFPQDVTYLGQLLNINIQSHNIVYVTSNSKKFHSNPNCSGIKNTSGVDLSFALDNGYVPCKRCCK